MAGSLARMLRLRTPTTVLMYHRVGTEGRNLHGLRVRDDHFAEQLDVVRRHAQIVPLTDVLTSSREPRVAITFDDGYADNLHVAAPALAARDAPWTIFVTAGVVADRRGFWQDRLSALLLDGDGADLVDKDVDVKIGDERVTGTLRDDAEREQTYRALHGRLRRRPADEIERALPEVAAQLGRTIDEHAAGAQTLAVDDVRTLARSEGVEIGAHTMRHPWLAALDAPAQRAEINESKTTLEAWTGEPVTTFAYPFGSADAFDTTSVRIAGETGFDVSVTALAGRVGRTTHAQRVPRHYVADWDGAAFEPHLLDWLGIG